MMFFVKNEKVKQERIKDLEKKLAEAVKALEWYADPYNCTPDRGAIYAPNVNKGAWEALIKIKSSLEEMEDEG
jgi:tetrahydromethanopterin S-methyltransferase subunit B